MRELYVSDAEKTFTFTVDVVDLTEEDIRNEDERYEYLDNRGFYNLYYDNEYN